MDFEELSRVINGLKCHAKGDCVNCPYRESWHSCNMSEDKGLIVDALKLLKAQREEIEELKQEIEGHIEDLKETLDVVTEQGRKLKAQEPVEPTMKNGAYFCGNPHCRKIIAQMVPCGAPTHMVKYCSECGRAVKWDG